MNLINNLEWRYATKKFDTSKKVSTENLEIIKKAIQLSASSYGLQLYKVFVIENQELRENLKQLLTDKLK
ncbi:nitroreductase family protein [Maribacter vaceletii]|uniref:nitroreductase family protein n=1 Tax=Maribacter vaceletii TaxID=1206816 RepID=UPI0026A63156|nr:nitroreductase family protein [Maribacter vaceletii]